MSIWKKIFGKETEQPEQNDIIPTKESDKAWIDLKGVVTEDKIKLEADWNQAFIDYLREHGYTGSSDEAIVQRYLAEMHQQLMAEENGSQYV